MGASDAHCRPRPRSRLSWCCALFGCSSRESARGGNRSERSGGIERKVHRAACLLACCFQSVGLHICGPAQLLSRKKRAVQVKSVRFFYLSVCVFVCLFVSAFLPCLLDHLRTLCLSLSLSLLVHVSLFCLDELLYHSLATHSSSLLTYTHPSSYSSPARAHSSSARLPVPLGPIKCSVWVQRWTGRDYDFSGALDF